MKKILTMALAMAALCGGSAMAQTNKMYQPQRFTDYAFEGILLDLNQQARIDSLNSATQAANPGWNGRAGEKADSVGGRERKNPSVRHFGGDRRMGMRQQPVSADYVLKVKEILTPEQYTEFLENIVLSPVMQGPATVDKVQGSPQSRRMRGDRTAEMQQSRLSKAAKTVEAGAAE